MSSRLLLTFSVVIGLRAQQRPLDLLQQVQKRILDSVNRLPRYMCTETIDRARYDPDARDGNTACDEGPEPKTHLATSDRLRLDVAMAAAVEMYSWVGERRFDDRDLADIVQEGAISTGSFAAFLTAIFRSDDSSFSYNGDVTEGGRTLSEFGFRVPQEKSHYTYGQGLHQIVVGYQGTFMVDAATADLVRLIVRTNGLPKETAACYASTTLDYGRVRLNGIDFLLPSSSLLRIRHTDRSGSQNRTAFTNCHEFVGESKISFDSSLQVATASKSMAQTIALPPGLPFEVTLTGGIDTATAAAGDPLRGKLLTPIRDGKKVLVPAGAAVAGRVVRVRWFYGDQNDLSFEFKLESVELGGAARPLSAELNAGSRFQKKTGTLQPRVELGTLRRMENRSAAFVFRGVPRNYLISSGLTSTWMTAVAGRP